MYFTGLSRLGVFVSHLLSDGPRRPCSAIWSVSIFHVLKTIPTTFPRLHLTPLSTCRYIYMILGNLTYKIFRLDIPCTESRVISTNFVFLGTHTSTPHRPFSNWRVNPFSVCPIPPPDPRTLTVIDVVVGTVLSDTQCLAGGQLLQFRRRRTFGGEKRLLQERGFDPSVRLPFVFQETWFRNIHTKTPPRNIGSTFVRLVSGRLKVENFESKGKRWVQDDSFNRNRGERECGV